MLFASGDATANVENEFFEMEIGSYFEIEKNRDLFDRVDRATPPRQSRAAEMVETIRQPHKTHAVSAASSS